MSAAQVMAEVVTATQELDQEIARWAAGDRQAGGTAVGLVSTLIVRLHRLHDALVDEIRRWDTDNRPYDPRD